MRFLLDQNVPSSIVQVLRVLHHEADHTEELGYKHARDPDIARLAEEYDVLITIDLHRQEADWIAVHRAIVERGVKVLRLRLPKGVTKDTLNLHIIRQLTYQMEAWTQAFESGAVLITQSREDKEFRIRSRDDVQQMLEHFRGQ